jgi:hypothetical protein
MMTAPFTRSSRITGRIGALVARPGRALTWSGESEDEDDDDAPTNGQTRHHGLRPE